MSNDGTSPLAVPASKQWNDVDRPVDWQLHVYGLVVHTTGSGLPESARKKGISHTDRAVDHYSESHGCHYVNGWGGAEAGELLQMANESEQAIGVGMSNPDDPTKDQKLSVEKGDWEGDLPAVLVKHWHERWPDKENPMQLLPGTKTANSCYIHCECVPCVYYYDGPLTTDATPLREGLRFTQAQHDTVAALAVDIAERNGWPTDQQWWRTPRLLGHEDLSPIARCDPNGGWDPGGLRDEPYFDWDYVYARIEELLAGGGVLPPPVEDPMPEEEPVSPFAVLGDSVDQFVSLVSAGDEAGAVAIAFEAGVQESKELTNLLFFARHPEMNGRKIESDETDLAAEWIAIRDDVVDPELASRSGG